MGSEEPSADPWEPLLDRFRRHLLVQEGLAEATVESYLNDLHDFVRFCRREGLTEPDRVDAFFLGDYLQDCRSREFASSTIVRRRSSLSRFFRLLNRRDQVDHNPVSRLDAPRVNRTYPNYLDESEVRRLLEQPDVNDPIGLRDRALLEVLYGAGLRVSEATDLRGDHVDWEREEIQVTGKGNKQRVVPVGREAIHWMQRYVEKARNSFDPESRCPSFFITDQGTALSRKQVWNIVKHCAERAGLNDVSPHTLRHSCATHLMGHGADLRSIQEMLGHADVGTTADFYLHLGREIRDAHEDFHPRGD